MNHFLLRSLSSLYGYCFWLISVTEPQNESPHLLPCHRCPLDTISDSTIASGLWLVGPEFVLLVGAEAEQGCSKIKYQDESVVKASQLFSGGNDLQTALSSLPSHLGVSRPPPGAAFSTWWTWGETGWPSDPVQFCSHTCTGQSASAPHTCWGTSWSGRCCSCCSPAAPGSGTRPLLVSGGKRKAKKKKRFRFLDGFHLHAGKQAFRCSDCKCKHGTFNNAFSGTVHIFLVWFCSLFSTWFMDTINRNVKCFCCFYLVVFFFSHFSGSFKWICGSAKEIIILVFQDE